MGDGNISNFIRITPAYAGNTTNLFELLKLS